MTPSSPKEETLEAPLDPEDDVVMTLVALATWCCCCLHCRCRVSKVESVFFGYCNDVDCSGNLGLVVMFFVLLLLLC